MPFDFQCPYCGHRTSVAEQYIGQTGPCSACGRTITVPPAPGSLQIDGSLRHHASGQYSASPPPLMVQCPACGYAGKVLVAHHGYKWWALPLGLLIACTGVGLIPLAIILIVVGNRTYRACPKCRNRQLAAWTGPSPPESEAIWLEATQADERAFKINKWILLAIVMAMLAAALVFMLVQMRAFGA